MIRYISENSDEKKYKWKNYKKIIMKRPILKCCTHHKWMCGGFDGRISDHVVHKNGPHQPTEEKVLF